MRRFTIAIALFVLLLVAITSAQQAPTTSVPNLIRYSGTLKDAQGAPLASTTVGVTFAIYKQQDGGAPIWMETQNVTTDASRQLQRAAGQHDRHRPARRSVLAAGAALAGRAGAGASRSSRACMMVSVPYAFKAHEAETLGGKSVSDFVLANGATQHPADSTSQTVQVGCQSRRTASAAAAVAIRAPPCDGPTNFSGSTTDQIVGVTQSGTGVAINATATAKPSSAPRPIPAPRPMVFRVSLPARRALASLAPRASTTGFTYGLRGTSSSTSGTGVRGIAVATSGSTIGISGYVDSAAGTAGVLQQRGRRQDPQRPEQRRGEILRRWQRQREHLRRLHRQWHRDHRNHVLTVDRPTRQLATHWNL